MASSLAAALDAQTAALCALSWDVRCCERHVADGPSGSEDFVVVVAYCQRELRFKFSCLASDEGPVLDVFPIDCGVDEDQLYDVFATAEITSAWTFDDTDALARTVDLLMECFVAHQRALVDALGEAVPSLKPTLEAVGAHDEVQVFVVPHGTGHDAVPCRGTEAHGDTSAPGGWAVRASEVHLVLPLCAGGGAELEAPELEALNMQVHATIRHDHATGHSATQVDLLVPKALTLSRTFRCPEWRLGAAPLQEHARTVAHGIVTPWVRRKQLCEALVATYSAVEYDPVDFSRVHTMIKVKAGKQPVLRLLEFAFSLDFPDKPPQLIVHDTQSGRATKLDPALYRFSPRWTPHRMGEELYNHARRTLPTLPVP